MSELIFDASDCIAGRLASLVAKEILKGNRVSIVNAEKAVILGNPEAIEQTWREKVERGHPYQGPFYPKQPERILRRIIRGMVPRKKPRGREALKRLRIFIGVPEGYEEREKIRPEKVVKKPHHKFIYLGELSLKLGGKKRW
ncbi:MAG: 50S ribosomal protein L13 [Candidatus Aenigmatarchaeota archaeon]|nr:MAG: 50S ribosomal protein L13 [Candidatus Aenigmarchaeota archaeon]